MAISDFFNGERAGRSTAQRAKASLFSHSCDVIAHIVDAVIELVPHVVTFTVVMIVVATLPVSVPAIAFLRRGRDRAEVSKNTKAD
jgi:hypothetical protein